MGGVSEGGIISPIKDSIVVRATSIISRLEEVPRDQCPFLGYT